MFLHDFWFSCIELTTFINHFIFFSFGADNIVDDGSVDDVGASLGDDFTDSLTELRFGEKDGDSDAESISDDLDDDDLDADFGISEESVMMYSYGSALGWTKNWVYALKCHFFKIPK